MLEPSAPWQNRQLNALPSSACGLGNRWSSNLRFRSSGFSAFSGTRLGLWRPGLVSSSYMLMWHIATPLFGELIKLIFEFLKTKHNSFAEDDCKWSGTKNQMAAGICKKLQLQPAQTLGERFPRQGVIFSVRFLSAISLSADSVSDCKSKSLGLLRVVIWILVWENRLRESLLLAHYCSEMRP